MISFIGCDQNCDWLEERVEKLLVPKRDVDCSPFEAAACIAAIWIPYETIF